MATQKKKIKVQRQNSASLTGVLKMFLLLAVLAGICVGFVHLEKYVNRVIAVSDRTAYLDIVNIPDWVTEPLIARLRTAAVAGGLELKLDEDAAMMVRQNIETQMSWLENVRVQITHESICVECGWRKPAAVIAAGEDKFYIDAKMAVMDFVDMPELTIVEIKGLHDVKQMPPAGATWQREDAAAALAIILLLEKMDTTVTPEKPLLKEIASVDVGNFNGRQSRSRPHIVLYAKDGTEIIWGAEFGTWQRYMEAPDDEKIAKLYGHYKEFGSLLNGVKFINLRESPNRIPQPIDKY